MSETIRLIVTKFNHESLTIFSILLLLTTIILIAYWFYNRKKFHDLSHQIPAAVVKTYLDTIIQNSNSLKSSLFRGGGLELGNGVPSVVPLSELPTTGVSMGSASNEELNQKIAEIAALNHKLIDKTKQITDLEKRLQDLNSGKGDQGEEVNSLRSEIGILSKKLKEAESLAQSASGGDAELAGKLAAAQKEKESLLDRLKEYEIIEEDLANLKRLQQENEQLRNEIEMLKKGGAKAPEVAAAAVPAAAATIPEVVADSDIDLEAEMAKAIADSQAPKAAPKTMEVEDIPANEGEQKSAEELLSEFEKILG